MTFAVRMFLIELALILVGLAPFIIGVNKDKQTVAVVGVIIELVAGCVGGVAIAAVLWNGLVWLWNCVALLFA